MNQLIRIRNFGILVISLIFSNCASIKRINERLVPEPYTYDRSIPMAYQESKDTTNVADIKWREYFSDQNLINLIDTALVSNQELLITLQDIEIAQNVINYRHGLLSPTVTAGGAIGFEKVGRFTSQGAG
ncbi:MAG: TolC family protein, partial [Saprospiraceae bacterium]